MADNHHIVTPKVYLLNAGALLVLMLLTVLVYYWHWNIGGFTLPIALGIAVMKATLIILFFMNVKYSSHLTWVFAGAGFVWLMILFGFTLVDHVSKSLGTPEVPPLPGIQ